MQQILFGSIHDQNAHLKYHVNLETHIKKIDDKQFSHDAL